ncbi:hypothetical protein Leryth_014953 [Lithospermum erythrorhizon]|nr:hypothetical protein Leryth_014953 [Lithospermum erythrorhizon]
MRVSSHGIYEIKKGDFSVKVTNYGARIVSVFLPHKDGNVEDVVLGYDTIEGALYFRKKLFRGA